jgi:hypothetical protein
LPAEALNNLLYRVVFFVHGTNINENFVNCQGYGKCTLKA